MKCRFCGVELADADKICPACGKKNKKTFPLWGTILIILFIIFVVIPVILFLIALLLTPILGPTPLFIVTLVFALFRSFFMGDFKQENLQISKSVSALKTVSVDFNKYIQEKWRDNGYYYLAPEDVWSSSILSKAQYLEIHKGIKLLNSEIEVSLEKLDRNCELIPNDSSKVGKDTACGILHIDVNGAENGPNLYSVGTDKKDIKDKFILFLYSNGVEPKSGTIEYSILKSFKF